MKPGLIPDVGAEPGEGLRRVLVSRKTEIKFAVDKGHKPTVMETMSEGARQPSTYEAIYFDTDNLDLKRHKVELRLQCSNGRIVQRIKASMHNGDLFACQSHKLVLSDLQPNIDHVRASLPTSICGGISLLALKPRFRTSFSRISRQFENAVCTTLTSFDEGFIEATGRSESISEVEFKLKGGSLGSYTEECLSFLDRVPATLLMESKAARGYRLASSELPSAVSAPHIVVPWNLPLPEAIMRILRHSFQHFLDNHPAVALSGTPESIHQMRVAMRRLRCAIRMFSPVLCLEEANSLLEGLRAFFTRLGEVREADVFIGETLPSVTRAGLGKKLESVLRREITAFRDGIYREARGELTSPEFARLAVQLNDWIEGGNWLKADRPIDALLVERSVEDFAVPRIRALYSKLLKQGSKARYGTRDDWHRTRIAAKKLRYAGEPLFGALAPKIDTQRLSKQLSRLQTSLGQLNDLQMITPFLRRVRPYVLGRNRRNFDAAEHFCRGWSGATAAILIDHAKEAIKGFQQIRLDASA
jgi:CHAD domain-containing protein